LQLVETAPGLVKVTKCGVTSDEQLQAINTLDPILGWHGAQIPFGEFDRCYGIVSVERKRGATEQRQPAAESSQGVNIELIEQCVRLAAPSLAPPQLGQPGDSFGCHSRECRRQLSGGCL
jgi:hypothetical protein